MFDLSLLSKNLVQLGSFFTYFVILSLIAYFSSHKIKSESDFIIGNRSLNFWLTALSAHASDMSSWLFLGYPALIFTTGMTGAWAAIGLVVCMFLNWHFIAPKLRLATEKTNSLTISAFFENRFADQHGIIRIISAIMSIFFFTFYISSGLVGMGILVESLFGLNYTFGITIGLITVTGYVFFGGYKTIAWIDLFQGFFLLAVIILIPSILLFKIGGLSPIFKAVTQKNLPTTLLPNFSIKTISEQLMIALGWGLGYFGQPHILTKFMGIEKISEMNKAKYLGISWQTLALTSATLIGLIAIYMVGGTPIHPEQVILEIVKTTLPAFFSGLVLCAILAATTNVMAAQILVVASNLSEDFYRKITHKSLSAQSLVAISRKSVLIVAIIAYLIAFFKISTIYELVLYSWSGLGASFGPLILLSLYTKYITKQGAICGILTGGISSAVWYSINQSYNLNIEPLVVSFTLGSIVILAVSKLTKKKNIK